MECQNKKHEQVGTALHVFDLVKIKHHINLILHIVKNTTNI